MTYRVYSMGVSGDTETPITLYKKIVGKQKGFLFETQTKEGKYSIIGMPTYTITWEKGLYRENIKGDKERIGTHIKDLQAYMEPMMTQANNIPFAGGLVGGISYDILDQWIPLSNSSQDFLHIPQLHLFDVREWIVYDHQNQTICLGVLEEDTQEAEARGKEKLRIQMQQIEQTKQIDFLTIPKDKKVGRLKKHLEKEVFIDRVKKAQAYIQEGSLNQVVLSLRWSIEAKVNGFQLYRHLREINPSPYLFYFNFGTYQVAGSSPEMLVKLEQGTIYYCPIAGTSKRGQTKEEDREKIEALRKDPKEQKEHGMLVDLGKEELKRVSIPDSVFQITSMEVKKYSHVMHLESMMKGEKEKNQNMLSILTTFLPAGTLSGTPKRKAIQVIDQLEREKRGLYGGGVGYLGYNNQMDFGIAIRMMILQGQKIYLQAGAGIIEDSEPEKEYKECCNKLLATLKAIEREIEIISLPFNQE